MKMYTNPFVHMDIIHKDVIDYIFKLIHKSNTITLIGEYNSSYTLRYDSIPHHCSVCVCTYKLTSPKYKLWGNNFVMNYRARAHRELQIYSISSNWSVAQLPKNYI